MALNPNITFQQMPSSPALEADIRQRVEALEHLFDRITSCRVVVAEPHRHQQHGRHFDVRIDLHVPGEELTAGRSHGDRANHEDPHVAGRDAFLAIERQLEHYIGRRRAELRAERA
ncbi:MAG TPA: HPF/RaiA family ribosome-associated protein [Polyangia bacterium]